MNLTQQAGWGIFNGNKSSDILLFAEIESVSNEVCWNEPRGDQFLSYLSSDSTFCGGSPSIELEQSKSPCQGDSGMLRSFNC